MIVTKAYHVLETVRIDVDREDNDVWRCAVEIGAGVFTSDGGGNDVEISSLLTAEVMLVAALQEVRAELERVDGTRSKSK